MTPLRIAALALVALTGCSSAPPQASSSLPPASPSPPSSPPPSATHEDKAATPASPTPPSSDAAGARTGAQEAPSPAFQAELAELRRCPDNGVRVSSPCKAYGAFTKERPDPMTLAEEDALFALLGDPRLHFAATMRLVGQPGPRTREPARALALVRIARDVREADNALNKWLGRAVGAVTLQSEDVRKAVASLVKDHPNEKLAGAVIVGIGVAHPRDPAALDMVDAALQDPRAAVRHGALDAYAETSKRDPARACAAWAKGLKDEANEVRAGALLSVTPECGPQHPLVLELAAARLAKDPNHAMAVALPDLCATPSVAKRVLPLASSLVTKVERGAWHDPLQAVGRCDPRGPDAALRPWIRRGGDIGHAAQRALDDIQREP